jgi:hypothetical protein
MGDVDVWMVEFDLESPTMFNVGFIEIVNKKSKASRLLKDFDSSFLI